ncbi:hypothetical protein [Acetobacter musti]|uniref:hypothetical protein n=1 Tax=Acetobacter musti TaxID=864732 RepID=UPI00156AF1CA|nr:hypothetical protein [Acetobacter musti]
MRKSGRYPQCLAGYKFFCARQHRAPETAIEAKHHGNKVINPEWSGRQQKRLTRPEIPVNDKHIDLLPGFCRYSCYWIFDEKIKAAPDDNFYHRDHSVWQEREQKICFGKIRILRGSIAWSRPLCLILLPEDDKGTRFTHPKTIADEPAPHR